MCDWWFRGRNRSRFGLVLMGRLVLWGFVVVVGGRIGDCEYGGRDRRMNDDGIGRRVGRGLVM